MKLEQIDTSTTEGKAEVMLLAAKGRKVAFKNRYWPDWRVHRYPQYASWDWPRLEYMIIAEPVGPEVIWATVIDGDTIMDVYDTEQQADAALNRGWEKVRYVRAD